MRRTGIALLLAMFALPLLAIDAAPPLADPVQQQRYQALGGRIHVIGKPGVGHHPHSLEDPAPIVDYILKNRLPD